MPIVVYAGRKGGCGKTTGATNFAAWLAQKGERVALLDTDPERQASIFFQLRAQAEGVAPIHAEYVTGDIYRTLESLAHDFDWVVVDTPGLDSVECRRAVGLATVAVFPFKTSLYDLRTIPLADDLLEEVRAVRPEVVGLAYCSETDNGLSGKNDRATALEWLGKSKQMKVLNGFTESRKSYKATASTGCGVMELRDAAAAAEFAKLSEEIASYAKR